MSETKTNTSISIKQRLVGAIVLISLAVIFIPMVLDGEGPFETDNSNTFIPDEPRFKFETPNAAIDSVVTQPAVGVADAAIVTGTFSGKEGRPEQDIAPVLTAKRANDDVNSDLTDKNVSIVDAIFDESVSKKALLAKSEIKNRTGDTSDDVMPALIKEVAPDLETTKPVVKTKEKDVKKVVKEKIVKESPQVSKPKAKIAALKNSKNETVKSWAVQLGSFKTKPNALRLRDKLRGKGFPSYVEAVTSAKGARYRVRVGPELKRTNAIALKKRLANVAKLDGLIVSH